VRYIHSSLLGRLILCYVNDAFKVKALFKNSPRGV